MASTTEEASAELEDLVKAFIEYWNCEDTLKIEENFLARLLHSKVKRKKECLVPTADELLAMVDHIEVIFKRYTHKDNKYTKGDKVALRKFFNLHLAFLLGLSEGALQTLRHGTLEDINYYLDNCYAFLRQFLSGYDPRTMGPNKKRPAPSESDENSSKIVKLDEAGAKSATEAGCSGAKSETEAGPSLDPKSTKKEGTRDRQLPDKVKSRDKGRCVVSGIGFGVEAAHVMAHTASNTSEAHGQQMLHWRIAELMFGSHLSVRLRQLFDKPNAAEQDWNMITLAAHIHFALDNGLLAFQPLSDAEPRSSILQFRLQWFDHGHPKNFHTKKTTPTTKSIEAMYSPLQNEKAIGRDVDMRTGRLILTDNVYEVEFALEDIESRDKMKFVMDARWKIQKIMFLAGAAGVTAEQFKPLEDDEDVDAVESDAHFELKGASADEEKPEVELPATQIDLSEALHSLHLSSGRVIPAGAVVTEHVPAETAHAAKPAGQTEAVPSGEHVKEHSGSTAVNTETSEVADDQGVAPEDFIRLDNAIIPEPLFQPRQDPFVGGSKVLEMLASEGVGQEEEEEVTSPGQPKKKIGKRLSTLLLRSLRIKK